MRSSGGDPQLTGALQLWRRPCESRDPYAETYRVKAVPVDNFRKILKAVVMGPCFRRDDEHLRQLQMRQIMRQRFDLFLAQGIGDIRHRGLAAAGSHA